MVELIPYDKTVEDFIQTSFQYFNGRINTTNPATLTVDWAGRYSSSIPAFSILPNRVIIHPLVAARFCPAKEYMNFQLVEYIIHELFHVDQIIEFKKLDNTMYVENIESAVEGMTANYFLNNHKELETRLGIYFDQSCVNYFHAVLDNVSHFNHPYERRTVADHIWMLLDQYTDTDYDSSRFREKIKEAVDGGYDIDIVFNGVPIEVQRNGIVDIVSLNYHLLNAYDGILGSTFMRAETYHNPNRLVIKFNGNCGKVMCDLVIK